MRVTNLEHHIRTQSGTDREEGWTYYSLKEDTVCIKGRYVERRITGHNHICGSKIRRTNELFKSVSGDFVKELRLYAEAYNKQLLPEKKCYVNYYNVFVKALCNGSVSLWELESLGVFVRVYGNDIESWIANGLLPKVKAKFEGYECFAGYERVVCEQPVRIRLLKGEQYRVRLDGVSLVVVRSEE